MAWRVLDGGCRGDVDQPAVALTGPGVEEVGASWRPAVASWCLPRWGKERGDGLAELLDPVEDRGAGAPQGSAGWSRSPRGRTAGRCPSRCPGSPGGCWPARPRGVLGVPQVHHPRIGQPGRVPAAAGVPDLLVDPDGIDPQPGLGMGGKDLGLHQPGAAATARSGGREDHQQAGPAMIGIEPGLQVPDPVQVDHPHPGRGRHRSEHVQSAGHQHKHQQAGGQEPDRTPPSRPWRRCGGARWPRVGHGRDRASCRPGATRPPRAAHAGCARYSRQAHTYSWFHSAPGSMSRPFTRMVGEPRNRSRSAAG